MWKLNWSRLTECLVRPQDFLLLLLSALFIFGLYFLSFDCKKYGKILVWKLNDTAQRNEAVEGYLVWNPKCHMLSMDPYDPSITKFIKKEEYVSCSSESLLTNVARASDDFFYLTINKDVAKNHKGLSCCWAPISRPIVGNEIVVDRGIDSRIRIGECQYFRSRALLSKNVETLWVTCKAPRNETAQMQPRVKKPSHRVIYENVHAVVDPKRVIDRPKLSRSKAPPASTGRPLSVLMLGIDSVSRLNFHRTMQNTKSFLEYRGWVELKGYNKIGDNTFPNLMAILTGQSSASVFEKCDPTVLYGLDNCSIIWNNFKDAGYATAFAEDDVSIGTFNYLKVGFVKPPTDYYLRPYALATEKLLKSKKRYGSNYCTGPELSSDRIYNFGTEFSKTFIGSAYFGFFWTNTISHNNVNGPSSYDEKFVTKLEDLENAGVTNDSMIILLSDHGMRFGEIRTTFVGWYEERLPFIYFWLPEWFRQENPEVYRALRINQNRLTSPYHLYETLRDVLDRSGGQAPPSSGCPACSTLFKPVPDAFGCKDAGIAVHWCACAIFEPLSVTDEVVVEGARRFVEHIDSIAERYKSKKGNRLCAKLKLKRIVRAKKVLHHDEDPSPTVTSKLFYLIETSPGDANFEATIDYHGPNNYTIRNEEISRINIYYHKAKCLNEGFKQYCHCVKG